jgi:hypothetical protein
MTHNDLKTIFFFPKSTLNRSKTPFFASKPPQMA